MSATREQQRRPSRTWPDGDGGLCGRHVESDAPPDAELGIRMEHVGHWYDRDQDRSCPSSILAAFSYRITSTANTLPGYYWHSIDAGVPLSGQPNRFVYADPRFGVSYDLFGHGNTMLRGGWGVYRFVTQVNTYPGGTAVRARCGWDSHTPVDIALQMQNISKSDLFALPVGDQVCIILRRSIGADRPGPD